MPMNQLIRCKNCDQVFLKSPFDSLPEYNPTPGLAPENFQTIERDDFQDFLTHHHGHQLEHLRIIEDSYVSEKAYSEPVKTSFFKATNGREKFVIKKFRERIDEPLQYQLIPGDYSLKCTAVEIQSQEISKQLKRDLTPSPSQDKIDAFLKLFRAIVEGIEVKGLERIPEDSWHPLEVYYKMDDVHLVYLLRNCRSIFKGREYSAMERFIRDHKEDGVLLLKATFEIELTEIVKPDKKKVSSFQPLEKQKVVWKK